MAAAATFLQLRSTVRADAKLQLDLATIDTPTPGDNEVLVEVGASPINPSDLGMLFGPADMTTARNEGTAENPVIVADIPEKLMPAVAGRVDQGLPVGNEGAGVVIEAGKDAEAQALLGRTVAVLGGGMYGQYRCMPARHCLVLNEGTTAAEGASCFVNPLTALGMVETMRLEGHTALVHTAAASNLGQMLVKICLDDDVPLVNIVRKQSQVDLLTSLGAKFVCNTSDPDFMEQLTTALVDTGATLGFDATGGGKLASDILSCMEAAAGRRADGFSRYGSTEHKQVYIYGGLDRNITTLTRNYGMYWGLGGWLLTPFLQKIGPEAADKLRQRVADEIRTTFASDYVKEVSLAEALSLESIAVFARQATGEKYLINPGKS
jgi:NADPH2:quinone reductase